MSVDAVAGDPRTDRDLDADIDVRATSQSNFAMFTSASGRTVESPCSSKGARARMARALPFSPQQSQSFPGWEAGM